MFQLKRAVLSILALGMASSTYAASPLNLTLQPASMLNTFLGANQAGFKEVSKTTDITKTTHLRLKQTYLNYPVWSGDIIVHFPSGQSPTLANSLSSSAASVNGVLFQNLSKDLSGVPSQLFSEVQIDKAITQAVILHQKENKISNLTQKKAEGLVFIDKQNKAHWAFLITMVDMPSETNISAPTYIIDAVSFQVYKKWNNLMNSEVAAGGNGGNDKVGEHSFDGLEGHLSKLIMLRSDLLQLCFAKNSNIEIIDGIGKKMVGFKCKEEDPNHNYVYWNGKFDAVNGGYSPTNDALFAGEIIRDMYLKWYNVPVLSNPDGSPIKLKMHVHIKNYDNAFFMPNNNEMYFGDGYTMFYPLTSLDVGAHEISHGFTCQHSNLDYSTTQGAALHESFSDMAAKAAEFFAYKKNSWELGADIFKEQDQALRYFEHPTKDCKQSQKPGEACSIENMKDFSEELDPHYACGVFNRAFYLIANSPGWDTKKAFDIMVKANQAYWRPQTDFHNAANCAVKSANDLGYDANDVKQAFNQVGIFGVNAENCY